MGDGRNRDADADDASWTDMGEVRPDLVESVPIRHGMVLGGRYAIEKIIGRGASGVVVRAHDRELRQEVAIKIVRAELVGQRMWAARLAREVKLARQIQHPNVCRVFDFEQAEGRAFLVMELAEKGRCATSFDRARWRRGRWRIGSPTRARWRRRWRRFTRRGSSTATCRRRTCCAWATGGWCCRTSGWRPTPARAPASTAGPLRTWRPRWCGAERQRRVRHLVAGRR